MGVLSFSEAVLAGDIMSGSAASREREAVVNAILKKVGSRNMYRTEALPGKTEQQCIGPGPPGAVERPLRSPQKIDLVWHFCMGAQGA